ncbi:TetR/AcrR family transcriptional regulator [Streptomyces sp. NPDC097981]|uniref:TetR/AcrR family transcriptional regulator n=1 Tax=Streptomyces sp. NPDC097981 TaxID=3155428 RepID=UPI00331CDA21
MADGRVERGNQTRRTVLGRTMDIASTDGLEGLSLGKIATDLGLSKSGVFALFGSKEDLQLATVRAAAAVFAEHVVKPVREEPAGIVKVWRLCEQWIDYSAGRVFPGGCFFYSAAAEFDSRPGPVRDEIAKARTEWTRYMEQQLDEARLAGGFREGTDRADVPQLAFEIIALMELANAGSVLHDDPTTYERAGRGILDRLRAVAAAPGELPQRPPAVSSRLA